MLEKLTDIPQVAGLNDRIYDALKEAIFKKILIPEQKIDVNALAVHWNVSRTPINDALQRLKAEGLVEVHPRKGTFVSGISTNDVLEQLQVRLMFELHAAELIAGKISGSQLNELKLLLVESEKLVNPIAQHDMDYITYCRLDIDFHTKPLVWTNNRQMLRIYQAQNFHWNMARVYYDYALSKTTEGQKEHWDIYHAYEEGDIVAITASIRRHIESSTRGIQRLVAKNKQQNNS